MLAASRSILASRVFHHLARSPGMLPLKMQAACPLERAGL